VLGGQPEPQGSYPIVGFANIDDWDALRRSPIWKHLVEKEGRGRVDAATTLDRIDVKLARRLIARGYLNTYLVSLFLAPLANGELDRLAHLENRLDQIVGIAKRDETDAIIGGNAAGALKPALPALRKTDLLKQVND
jgi:hypothetical protein